MAGHQNLFQSFNQRQVVDFFWRGGRARHELGRRHDFARNLIRAWIQYEAGELTKWLTYPDCLNTQCSLSTASTAGAASNR